MRLAGLAVAALAAMLAGGGPAGAQGRSPAALEAGETLLEVDSIGKVKSRADAASLYVVVSSSAASAAQARAQNSARVDRVTAAAKSAGAVSVEPSANGIGWRVGFVGNAAADASLPAAIETAGKTETAMLEVRMADPDRAQSVRAAVEQAGADRSAAPSIAWRRIRRLAAPPGGKPLAGPERRRRIMPGRWTCEWRGSCE